MSKPADVENHACTQCGFFERMPTPKYTVCIYCLRGAGEKGYVYFIKAKAGLYKIGKSVNWKSRVEAIRTSSSAPIRTICVFETNNMGTLENQFHAHFRNKRVHGEWFSLDRADLSAIKKFKAASCKRVHCPPYLSRSNSLEHSAFERIKALEDEVRELRAMLEEMRADRPLSANGNG